MGHDTGRADKSCSLLWPKSKFGGNCLKPVPATGKVIECVGQSNEKKCSICAVTM